MNFHPNPPLIYLLEQRVAPFTVLQIQNFKTLEDFTSLNGYVNPSGAQTKEIL